jgi:hypothetical protein
LAAQQSHGRSGRARSKVNCVRRVGVLMSYLDNDLEAQAWVAAFHQGLQKLGWVEGRNIHSDSRWARGEDTEALQKFRARTSRP